MSNKEDWPNRLCAACGQCKTPEGQDPCIANLPGVIFACCGHGNENGYIKFRDGRVLRFNPVEVDLDLPTVKVEGIPVFQLGGSRVFDYARKKVKLSRYPTNIMKEQ